jgi:hypothetical protein
MLTNPSIGTHHSHPLPHPSELTPFKREDKFPLSSDQLQREVDQAVTQLTPEISPPAKSEPSLPPPPEPENPSPPKPITIISSTAKSPGLGKISPEIAQNIHEELTLPQDSDTAIEKVKKLSEFKPVVFATVVFVLGILAAAIIGIVIFLAS